MSNSTLQLSPINQNNLSHPDLAALAASLQEAAQAVLALSPVTIPEEPKVLRASYNQEGETRSFYFPPASVNMERELLRKYHVENFQGLLEEVHTLLVGLATIMKSVHKEVQVKGYVISSLGAQLNHASALVLRMRNIYDKVMPVQN